LGFSAQPGSLQNRVNPAKALAEGNAVVTRRYPGGAAGGGSSEGSGGGKRSGDLGLVGVHERARACWRGCAVR